MQDLANAHKLGEKFSERSYKPGIYVKRDEKNPAHLTLRHVLRSALLHRLFFSQELFDMLSSENSSSAFQWMYCCFHEKLFSEVIIV